MSAKGTALRAATAFMGAVGLTGAGVAWNARYRAPYRPLVARVALRLPPGHAGLDGFRIGFVTDSHVGPTFTARKGKWIGAKVGIFSSLYNPIDHAKGTAAITPSSSRT